ncbi:hypothetical protein [Methanolapillus africanus]|uniref:hypothetical protein n=1 Tax=Methanolapillus africanus TaxID=3028297 RepID=UPI0030B8E4D7
MENMFRRFKLWRTPKIDLILEQLEQTGLYHARDAVEIRNRFKKTPKVCDVLLYVTSELERMHGSERNGKIILCYSDEFDCIYITFPVKKYRSAMDDEIFELELRTEKKFGPISDYVFVMR